MATASPTIQTPMTPEPHWHPMRRAALLAALALAALLLPAAVSGDEAPAPTVVPCNELPVATTAGELGLVEPCAPGIRPGAKATNACTLGWVLTDGTELYITAAGHCAPLGRRVHVEGLGLIGTVVHSRSELGTGGPDWALVRIDAEDVHHVEASMCRWGGPSDPSMSAPAIGDLVHYYGHGRQFRETEETRGRTGVVLPDLVSGPYFTLAGVATLGDSGDPVRTADGRAVGFLTAIVYTGPSQTAYSPVSVASRLDLAVADFESVLGVDLALVQGDAVV